MKDIYQLDVPVFEALERTRRYRRNNAELEAYTRLHLTEAEKLMELAIVQLRYAELAFRDGR